GAGRSGRSLQQAWHTDSGHLCAGRDPAIAPFATRRHPHLNIQRGKYHATAKQGSHDTRYLRCHGHAAPGSPARATFRRNAGRITAYGAAEVTEVETHGG